MPHKYLNENYFSRQVYTMPFKRNYRQRPKRKPQPSKATKSYVNRAIKKSENKDNPLMWADLLFTGDSVSTSPDAYSLLYTFINGAAINTKEAWPATTERGQQVRKAKIKLESAHYQLRYQNNTADLYSTARFLAYSTSYPIDSGSSPVPSPVMQGVDIDQPPDTSGILNMYFDKIRYVRDMQADEDSEAPGTAILKGNIKIGRVFSIDLDENNDWFIENNDVRYEHQSNSSVGPHPSLYGFIRVYGRVIY